MYRWIPVSLIVVASFAASLPAQQARFSEVFERHSRGADVTGELRTLSKSSAANEKDRFNASYLLAVIALSESKTKSALAHLEAAEKLTPGTAQVDVRRAEAHLLEKRYETAEKLLAAASRKIRNKKSPLYLRYSLVAARLDGKKGKAKRGLARLKKIRSKFKKSWELWFLNGHLQEALDRPKDAIAAYEKAIALLPQRDPCPGVYALQRWAALSVSSNSSSYGDAKIRKSAIERYKEFLRRAPANGVPAQLQETVRQAVSALEYFGQKR